MNLRENRKTGAIQALCRLPADGKAATWQLPVQPGGTGLAYMVALPSAGRRQRPLHLCRLPADGRACHVVATWASLYRHFAYMG